MNLEPEDSLCDECESPIEKCVCQAVDIPMGGWHYEPQYQELP